MTATDRWLLPEGVEEILPAEAYRLESLRRQLLDLYAGWGYDLVITPLIEYLDSLLVGSSHDLDLQTFKITDQLTGRMMGVRADITPQVARIDAYCLGRQAEHYQGPVRLCYADHVLHARPRGLLASRVPMRIGAELFGHEGAGCDIELICLMHETLEVASIGEIHVVLGHVGLFRTLVDAAMLDADTEAELFGAIQRKAYEETDALLNARVEDQAIREMLDRLSRLSGDESVLADAEEAFRSAPEPVRRNFQELQDVARGVKQRLPGVTLGFDLCELRGYEYHTGIVFAAYTAGYGQSVAQGGRYNDIGQVFGRARPASGFDADLKAIARLSSRDFTRGKCISAPCVDDVELGNLITRLRQAGERVIVDLDNDVAKDEALRVLGCDRRIQRTTSGWQVGTL